MLHTSPPHRGAKLEPKEELKTSNNEIKSKKRVEIACRPFADHKKDDVFILAAELNQSSLIKKRSTTLNLRATEVVHEVHESVIEDNKINDMDGLIEQMQREKR